MSKTLLTLATFILLISRVSVSVQLEVGLLVETFITDFTRELHHILMISLHVVSQLALPIKFQAAIGKITGKGMTFALVFWEKVKLFNDKGRDRRGPYLLHVSCMLSKYKKFDDKSHREEQCSCECSDGHTGRTLCQTWLHKTDRKIGVGRSLPAPAPRISSQDLGLSFLLIHFFF